MHLHENAKKNTIKTKTKKKRKKNNNKGTQKRKTAYFSKMKTQKRKEKKAQTLEERCKLSGGEHCINLTPV